MQKIIIVNQSVTVDGVTVTLEKIELNNQEMKVYASSPDLPQVPQDTQISLPITTVRPTTPMEA